MTHAKAAELLNVSERSVDTASALKNGVVASSVDPEVPALVDKGELTLAKAAKVARLPKNEQLAAAVQTDRRTPVAKQPRRKPFHRQADDWVRKFENLCAEGWGILGAANEAGKLTPDLIDKFVAAGRQGLRELEVRRTIYSVPSGTESSAA